MEIMYYNPETGRDSNIINYGLLNVICGLKKEDIWGTI